MKSRLQEKYRSETVPALMKHFGWKNMMAVPKLKKVTVNIGLGEASQNAKLLDTAAVELGQITGQKPIITRAKKSIANFKIRKGDQVRVIAGRDAGKSGRVLSVNAKKNTVVVEHIAIMKRHTRPNPGKNIKGGIVEKEAGINVSNVMVVCSNCGKHSRIGHNILPDGTKVRTCKRCNSTLDK